MGVYSHRGSVVLSKPVSQSLLLQLRGGKKGVESGQERGEERHPRRNSKLHLNSEKPESKEKPWIAACATSTVVYFRERNQQINMQIGFIDYGRLKQWV